MPESWWLERWSISKVVYNITIQSEAITTLNVVHWLNRSVLFFNIMHKCFVPSWHKFKNAVVVEIIFPLWQLFTNNNLHFLIIVQSAAQTVWWMFQTFAVKLLQTLPYLTCIVWSCHCEGSHLVICFLSGVLKQHVEGHKVHHIEEG